MDTQEGLSPEEVNQTADQAPERAAEQAPVLAEDPIAEVQPDTLLKEFRERSEALDSRLDTLQDLIQLIRGELHDDSQQSLRRLAQAADDMANGRVFQQIDIQAKGELGALVSSLNTTLMNLQQLDSSVKHQTDQVPELAAQLDAITADTETATQNVMNRLDTLMAASDEAGSSVKAAVKALMATQEAQAAFHAEMDQFLTRATEGAEPTQLAQEILEFIFAHQMAPPPPSADMEQCLKPLTVISDEAFEILNTLQFQDITRQKVEKIVMLLKQFKEGLNRLLAIFRIGGDGAPVEAEAIFDHRAVATQENIFETTLVADGKRESVDDIIAQFKKAKG